VEVSTSRLGSGRGRAVARWVVGVAVAWAVASTAACATGGEVSAETRAEDVAVQAATVRWLIENNDSALGGSASAYCLGIGTGLVVGEPSNALLRALGTTFPRVQPVSSCRWARDAVVGRRVVDELSAAPALALFVDLPEFDGPDVARVWAEYLERPGHGRGYDCRLVRDAEGWRVAECSRGFPR
jgi:hypothetical protein